MSKYIKPQNNNQEIGKSTVGYDNLKKLDLNQSKETALRVPISQSKDQSISSSPEHETDINEKDSEGNTLLHYAVLLRDIEGKNKKDVESLLDQGANVNAQNKAGKTPLYVAVEKGNIYATQSLMEKNPDITIKANDNTTILDMLQTRYGTQESYITFMKMVLGQKGENLNAKDSNGKTPLGYAMQYSNYKVAKDLLKNGANINAQDNAGNTLLHLAASTWDNNKEKLQFLLENGADINAKNSKGDTLLHYAERINDKELIQFLLKNGADINEKDKSGNTLLHRAELTWDNNKEKLQFLLENGVDINAKNGEGKTLLHDAAILGDHRKVKFLLNNGANVNAQDNAGNTPLHYGLASPKKENFEEIIKYVDSPERLKNMLLKDKAWDMTRSLVQQKGSDLNIKNKSGETPLQYAFNQNNLNELIEKSVLEKIYQCLKNALNSLKNVVSGKSFSTNIAKGDIISYSERESLRNKTRGVTSPER